MKRMRRIVYVVASRSSSSSFFIDRNWYPTEVDHILNLQRTKIANQYLRYNLQLVATQSSDDY